MSFVVYRFIGVENDANSLGKLIFQRSAFRRHARVLAACLLRLDHINNSTDELFRFHNNKFDEMLCKLGFIENPCSFEKYPNLQ